MKGGGGKLKFCMIYVIFVILFSFSVSERTSGEVPPPTPCSRDDILINQGPMAPFPGEVPTYGVVIENNCATNCTISRIHVHCGSFSSTSHVDPTIFRRLAYDDCLVKNGDPLDPGENVQFVYTNKFPYLLSVSSVECYDA